MDLDQTGRLLPERPVRRKLVGTENPIDAGRLVCIGGREVALKEDAGVLQDRRAVVAITDEGHPGLAILVDSTVRWHAKHPRY